MSSAEAGILISFEGIEGCGKSTQIARLAEFLEKSGYRVVATREPGATLLGRELRRLLLDPAHDPDALTELLLYLADRRDHLRRVMHPALEQGAVVLVDRYIDSTWAYQGFAGGDPQITTELVEKLNRLVVGECRPQLTFLLDCPVEVGLGRARQRNREIEAEGVADRFEQRRKEFHERVRAAFLELAAREAGRFQVIDADRPEAEIFADIRREFVARYAAS
jgi:dTMP kinase